MNYKTLEIALNALNYKKLMMRLQHAKCPHTRDEEKAFRQAEMALQDAINDVQDALNHWTQEGERQADG